MDAREFDALISRIASSASRRDAVRGAVGGALVSVGALAAVDAEAEQGHKGRGAGKTRKHGKGAGKGKARGKERNAHKRVSSEHNTHNGKRTLCICKDDGATTTVAPSTSTTTPPKRANKGKQARAAVCETQRLKPKKAKKALRDNPGSYRGPCDPDRTTLSPISSTSTSTSSTTGTSSSTSTTVTSTSTSTTSTSTTGTSTSTTSTTFGS
ncbi:MAG: hypothetical protein QM692_03995 [Thermomicrobiales bacterium]